MIQETRVHPLNDALPRKGAWVLNWMQASQRATCNHALEFAIRAANERRLPILVAFGIAMVVRRGEPDRVATSLARRAALVVVDGGVTRLRRLRPTSGARHRHPDSVPERGDRPCEPA